MFHLRSISPVYLVSVLPVFWSLPVPVSSVLRPVMSPGFVLFPHVFCVWSLPECLPFLPLQLPISSPLFTNAILLQSLFTRSHDLFKCPPRFLQKSATNCIIPSLHGSGGVAVHLPVCLRAYDEVNKVEVSNVLVVILLDKVAKMPPGIQRFILAQS